MVGRAQEVTDYLNLIDETVKVKCSLLTPRVGITKDSLINFLNVDNSCFTVQVKMEMAHAIAVDTIAPPNKGKPFFTLVTYD